MRTNLCAVRLWALIAAACAEIFLLVGCVSSTRPGAVGVQREQMLIVSAEEVNGAFASQYQKQNTDAVRNGTLIRQGPEFERIRKIANRIIPQTRFFRDDTSQWKWGVVLIDEPTVNANCGAGGKITFYTGIIRQLRLTDGEIAAVMGHEVGHAIREHSREKMSQALLQNSLAALAISRSSANENTVERARVIANYLITLPYSREMEVTCPPETGVA